MRQGIRGFLRAGAVIALIGSLAASAVEAQTIIAVVDSGVDASHPDLVGQLVAGYDFTDPGTAPDDELGHGTEVTGILVGNGGVVGLCTTCKVMPLRVADRSAYAEQSDIAAAITYAVSQGAHVILVSLGSIGASSSLAAAVAAAEASGIPVIAPTGNLEVMHVLYPAAFPSVISTSAMMVNGERLRLSNSSGRETVAALGQDVLTTRLGGGTVARTGTSVAAARVAGAVALLLEANPSLDTTQIRQAIRWGTTAFPLPGWNEYFEMGVHDSAAALARQASGFTDIAITRVTVFPESPLAGQANFARVRLVNQGNTSVAGPLSINVNWGGAPIGTTPVAGPIAPGEAIEEDIALSVAGAPSTVSIITTVSAASGETQFANNVFLKDVIYTNDPVHDVDLIVSELSEPVLEAGSITFEVLVRNRGNQIEDGTALEVTVDGGLVLAQSLDLAVGAEESVQVSWTISPTVPGSGHFVRVRATISDTDVEPENNDWYLDFDIGNRDGLARLQYADTPGLTDVIMDAPWRSEVGYAPVLFFFPQFGSSRRVETARIRNFDLVQEAPVGNAFYSETHSNVPALAGGVSILGPLGQDLTNPGGIASGSGDFWHYLVRVPQALIGIPGSQGNFGVHYLFAETLWSYKFLIFRIHYSDERVLRVRFDDSSLPSFDPDDRYFDAHVHTIAEQTTRNRFHVDGPNKNFGGPIAMLVESSYALGLVDKKLNNGNWSDFKDRIVVTDHNVFYSGAPFEADSTPAYGPSAGPPAAEATWYRDNLGRLAGEEVALASGSNQLGLTGGLNIGHHFLAYDTAHIEGPWHGGDLVGLGENNANDMQAVLTAMKGHSATGFGYAAHPNLDPFVWPPEYYNEAIGTPTATRSRTGPHVNSDGTEFHFKGSQIWNAKSEEVANDNGDLNVNNFEQMDPFTGNNGSQEFVYSQEWIDQLDESFEAYQGRLRGGFAFSFSETPKERFIRKIFMSAGTDAHGDFNYLDDTLSTGVETIGFDTGSLTSNAYARVRTYALVHDRASSGFGEQTAHDAYREGNTVLTDGPVCRLRIDSEGRHDTEPNATPRWHDASNVYENAEGRIGGSGNFDGGRSVLIVQPTSSGDPDAWIETKWLETVDPDHDDIDNFILTNTAATANSTASVPAGPPTAVKRQKMPGAGQGMSLKQISAITMEGMQDSTVNAALDERCITNPIWALPVEIDVSHPAVCPIPAGALKVDFHFPITMTSHAGVFIAPLDGAGNSGAGIQLQAAPGWQEENDIVRSKWRGKNTSSAIPCPPGEWDAVSHTAMTNHWSYVVYMDDPKEANTNQLNDIGRTFVVKKKVVVTTEVDHFEHSRVEFVLDIPNYAPVTVSTRGASTHHVDLSQIVDTDMNTFDQVSAEFVHLSTEGKDAAVGPVEVRLHSYIPSVGEIEENQQVTPGQLDLPPFLPGTGTATSHYATYLELSLPDLGMTLQTQSPIPLETVITHKPPKAGDVYTSASTVDLYDLLGAPAGTISSVSYEPEPAPSAQTFAGIAGGGGTISYLIDGASGEIDTVAGWTSADAAAALASAINADPLFEERAVSAIHSGSITTIYGSLDAITITDAGLSPPSIPAVSTAGLMLVFSCLIAVAAVAIHRKARASSASEATPHE